MQTESDIERISVPYNNDLYPSVIQPLTSFSHENDDQVLNNRSN